MGGGRIQPFLHLRKRKEVELLVGIFPPYENWNGYHWHDASQNWRCGKEFKATIICGFYI
jgi:hypothetical protein